MWALPLLVKLPYSSLLGTLPDEAALPSTVEEEEVLDSETRGKEFVTGDDSCGLVVEAGVVGGDEDCAEKANKFPAASSSCTASVSSLMPQGEIFTQLSFIERDDFSCLRYSKESREIYEFAASFGRRMGYSKILAHASNLIICKRKQRRGD